jgi:hypothetical protein
MRMSKSDDPMKRIVGRVTVYVFSDNPNQCRADLPYFQEELQRWPMTNPRAFWDTTSERLILEVDVTAHERDRFGLEVYADLVADEAYKIAVATMADIGDGGVGVLSIQPA